MPTLPRYHYTAEIEFDQSHDDTERREWLAAMRAHLIAQCDAEYAFDASEMIELDGSTGSVVIEFDAEQTPIIRRARMRHLADTLERFRLYYPGYLPAVVTTKYRMA